MKHWHRCQRWEERGFQCPYVRLQEHEEIGDNDPTPEVKELPKPGAERKLPDPPEHDPPIPVIPPAKSPKPRRPLPPVPVMPEPDQVDDDIEEIEEDAERKPAPVRDPVLPPARVPPLRVPVPEPVRQPVRDPAREPVRKRVRPPVREPVGPKEPVRTPDRPGDKEPLRGPYRPPVPSVPPAFIPPAVIPPGRKEGPGKAAPERQPARVPVRAAIHATQQLAGAVPTRFVPTAEQLSALRGFAPRLPVPSPIRVVPRGVRAPAGRWVVVNPGDPAEYIPVPGAEAQKVFAAALAETAVAEQLGRARGSGRAYSTGAKAAAVAGGVAGAGFLFNAAARMSFLMGQTAR